MAPIARVTRFSLEVQDRDLKSFERFSAAFRKTAQHAAKEESDPALAHTFVSRATFARWITGQIQRTPNNAAATVLRHMFGMSVERLFQTVSEESTPLLHPQAPIGPGVEFDDPLQVIAQARTLTSSNTDPALLTMASASIRRIIDRYEVLGPQQLAGEARMLRTTLQTLIAGQQPAGMRTDLFLMAAKVSGLLAYMAVNANAPFQVADAYCTEAEELAEAAGRPDGEDDAVLGLRMWTAGTRSLALYYNQRYAEAHAAAQAGIDLDPGNPQAIRLLINGCARALARTGDRLRAEAAIGTAMALSDRQPHLPTGLTSCIDFVPYSPARTLANAITARLSLTDYDHVHTHAAEIDELIEHSDSDWSRALVRLDVATALLRQEAPELEHAMLLGRRALHAGTTAPIRSVWQRASELYVHAAERWRGEPAVGDYAEDLRMWRAQPQAAPVAVTL
ncbi:hypothetical protein ACFY1P_20285 [Streptomyces sp. NPDC001407]|uniref:hypothetical protein n=1 Tax=Streptomyces sp. NPDC001407 TaxID=3364573 RepID=UPI003693E321